MPFAAGQRLKASDLGQLSTSAQYDQSSAQTIGNNADTPVAFGTANFTTGLVTRAASGVGHKFTLNDSGLWAITWTVQFDAAATGERETHLMTTGGNRHVADGHAGDAGAPSTIGRSILKYFAATTELEVQVFQNSGAPLDINAVPAFAVGRIDIVFVLG